MFDQRKFWGGVLLLVVSTAAFIFVLLSILASANNNVSPTPFASGAALVPAIVPADPTTLVNSSRSPKATNTVGPTACAPRDNPDCARIKWDNQEKEQKDKQLNAGTKIPPPTIDTPMDEPPDAKEIYPLPEEGEAYKMPGGPNRDYLRLSTSTWKLGAVPNAKKSDWFEFYVWVGKDPQSGNSILGTLTLNSTKEVAAKYDKIRQFPKEIGVVNITAATGPEGVISFKGSIEVTGKFDLVTEKWNFSS